MPIVPVSGHAPAGREMVVIDTNGPVASCSSSPTTNNYAITASSSNNSIASGSVTTASPRFSKAGLIDGPERPTPKRTRSSQSPSKVPGAHQQTERRQTKTTSSSSDDDDDEDDDEDSVSLAKLIQARRRQASAPYASVPKSPLFSPGAGSGFTSLSKANQQPPTEAIAVRRGQRSRPSSRSSTVSGLHLDSLATKDFSHHGMVMTPTTEEWRSLGGQLLELAKKRGDLSSSSSTSSIQDQPQVKVEAEPEAPLATEDKSPSRRNSMVGARKNPLSLSFDDDDDEDDVPLVANTSLKHTTSFSFSSNKTGHTPSRSLEISNTLRVLDDNSAKPPSSSPLPLSPTFEPFDADGKPTTPRTSVEGSRPNLSRGSLSSTTSKPTSLGSVVPKRSSSLKKPVTSPSYDSAVTDSSIATVDDLEKDELDATDIPPPSPVSLADANLTVVGPVDPSKYSAVTGLRSISDFIVQGEAGKGAYGTVHKARLKGPDGNPVGPELIIKYVIKQRILADCWKKHKILGPIPIEVHVLDHLRRVPYVPRRPKRRRAANGSRLGMSVLRRDSAPSIKDGVVTGHPNICGMLDFFEDGEFYYLVMPQAGTDPDNPNGPKGTDLFDYVDMHPDGLDPSTIRTILSQIADALYFLHSHNIVHRDIKDENVVLSSSLHVSLIDFGSAAYVKEGKKFDTFSGTLDFAAPEVLKGARYGGKETDIWALGVLAYVLICGECPFWSPNEAMEGLAQGSRALAALHAKVEATSPLEQRQEMALAVDVVERCLEVDPSKRPTADDLFDHAFFVKAHLVVGETEGGGEEEYEGWKGHMGWLD